MKKNTLKRTLSVVLSLLMVVGLFSSIPVSAASDDGIIYNDDTGIPDPVLYKDLISEYDINNDGVLQKEEADSIITIDCGLYDGATENPVYSLKGLNKCKNLKIIYFNYNKLSNLNGIEGLNLIHIYVNSNELTDITAIIGMEESLETLSVNHNLLSSLPDMKNFNNLKLNLRYYVTDFSYNKLLLKELNEKLPTQLSGDFNYWMQSQNPDLGEFSLFDEDTGIEVQGTMDPNATLKVEKVESTVEDAVATYDITLRKDGDVIQPSGTITISIPSEIKDCKLFWIKDDGTKVEVNSKYENGKYVFTTDHLSVYALVKEPESTTVEPPETTVPEPTATEPIETTVPEPTATEPIETTVPEPTATEPIETTVPEPTVTEPIETTVPETTATEPIETTVPEPTVTEPIETTVPEPTATEPIETTVPVPTVTEQVETTVAPPETTVESATDKVEPTKSVATPDTPNNNSNSGSSSGSSSASINNSSIVATGDMLGASNLLLLSIIIMSATTGVSVILFRRKKEKVSNK